MRALGGFETEVLRGVACIRGDAYGVTIAQVIGRATGRSPSIGAIYTTLQRLEQKGLLASAWGAPAPERGGRRKRLYTLTGLGESALRSQSAEPHWRDDLVWGAS